MKTRRVKLGKILSPFGVKGWVHFFPYVDVDFNWSKVGPLHIELRDGTFQPTALIEADFHKKLRFHFEGYDDRNQAEAIKDCTVWIDVAHLPDLPEGDFYEFELIDAPVDMEDGTHIGRVTHILPTGEQQVLVVATQRDEILIPINEENIKDMSPTRIVVHPIDGILDLNA